MNNRARGLGPGELARAAGVSTDTLRHYERLGVLAEAPRTQSGYRVYPPNSIDRVNMIRNALRIGFTLAELAEILQTKDRGGVPCNQVLGLLERKLVSLDQEIKELEQLRRYMKQVVGDWRSKVGHSGPAERAHLLHSLGAAAAHETTKRTLQRRRKQR